MRLDAWDQGGRLDLENAPTFYRASGQDAWHGDQAKPQDTWKQLIRMLLLARGKLDTDAAILNYQRDSLGRVDGETCLAELLPLPAPKMTEWRYRDWSRLHWLDSREKYYGHLLVTRAWELSRKLQPKPPSVVIFYGSSFYRTWGCVAGATWAQAIPDQLMGFSNEQTVFFVTKHPADPKLNDRRDAYFRNIGEYLRREHGHRFS